MRKLVTLGTRIFLLIIGFALLMAGYFYVYEPNAIPLKFTVAGMDITTYAVGFFMILIGILGGLIIRRGLDGE